MTIGAASRSCPRHARALGAGFALVLLAAAVPAPCIFRVAPADRVNAPVFSVSVRPLATFHDSFTGPMVRPELIVRFWLARLLSMPDAPSVSVLAELAFAIVISTVPFAAPPTFAILMPSQLWSPP